MRSILALAIALLLAGCGGETTTTTKSDTPETPKEKGSFVGDGYSINPPEGWEHKPLEMGSVKGDSFLAAQAPGANFRTNLVIMKEVLPMEMTVATYGEKAIPMMSSMLKNYNLVSQEDTKLGGLDAIRVEVEHRMGEMDLSLVQYMVVSGMNSYSVGCTTAKGQGADEMKTCEDAVKSWLPD